MQTQTCAVLQSIRILILYRSREISNQNLLVVSNTKAKEQAVNMQQFNALLGSTAGSIFAAFKDKNT